MWARPDGVLLEGRWDLVHWKGMSGSGGSPRVGVSVMPRLHVK